MNASSEVRLSREMGLKDPQGFMSGWMSWFAHPVACSLYALGFGAYFQMVLRLGSRSAVEAAWKKEEDQVGTGEEDSEDKRKS